MTAYVVRRLAWGLLVLLTLAVITFFLTYVLPADPASLIAGPGASAADVARIHHALGLDQPFLVQLGQYLGRVLQGNFGHSYQANGDVLSLVLARFPATAELAVAGLVLEVAIGLPLGVTAASRRGTWFDRISTTSMLVLVAAPSFWVGSILLEAVFRLNQAGVGGLPPVGGGYQFLDLQSLFLPALTLGFSGAAYYNRLIRVTLIEELQRDYVRTARAKGLAGRAVVWRHALRNAVGPLVTQMGLDFGFFLGGVVVIEQVFGWPGIGKLAVESFKSADVPVIMGTVLFGALCIVLANLLADVINASLDPRIRIEGH